MSLAISKFDYYETINPNLKIVEDDYGNLKISDDISLSEIPLTDILSEDFSYRPDQLRNDNPKLVLTLFGICR